eukprot:scaffold18241_cov119-Skeletonema_marinoi.AAC.2
MDPSDVNLLFLALTTATPKAIKTAQRMIGDDGLVLILLPTKPSRDRFLSSGQPITVRPPPLPPQKDAIEIPEFPVAIESRIVGLYEFSLFGLQYLRCGGNQASHLLLSLGGACVMCYAFTPGVHNIED